MDEAVDALRAGRVIAVPTDTVYGVAVAATVVGATERIFELKHRPRDLELPVLVADADQALTLIAGGQFADAVRRLTDRYWPGPLTVVLRRAPGVDFDLGGNPSTIGLRVPDHDAVRELCRRVGPLATTSANRHGQPTLTTAAAVSDAFGDEVAVVLDGGECAGAPSTVIDATGPTIALIREGRVPWADVDPGPP